MRIQWTIAFVALAASQLGATDCGNVLKDPGFDLWCDGQLCAWQVERGSVAQVPTWNQADSGVEFDGADVAISQISPVSSSDGSCIEFDLIADVDDDAEVDLNFDAFADGTVEFTQRIPTSSWAPVSFVVDVGGVWSGMRFEIAKHGNGHAVVAQLAAKIADPSVCSNFTPAFTPSPAPLGASCSPSEQCGSGALCEREPPYGILNGNVCMGCLIGSDASCGSGNVCGLGDPISPVLDVPIECVPAAARPLGAPCITDGECETGICEGACSACRDDLDCGSGQQCGLGWSGTDGLQAAPFVCAPGQAMQASGGPCASNGDCRSGACIPAATLMECSDGRVCKTNLDCPFDGGDSATVFDNGPCTAVGILGGTCQ
ncbi:MAG TPA: hypothetical protein VGG74_34885 [Kofleriaceae bacterium]|jgi:hypothetical protein